MTNTLDTIISTFDIKIKGVVHIGTCNDIEKDKYIKIGISDIAMINIYPTNTGKYYNLIFNRLSIKSLDDIISHTLQTHKH